MRMNRYDAASKEDELKRKLGKLESVMIAFSGGVDSSYLAFVATEVLGEAAVCVTGLSPSVAGEHRDRALRVAGNHRFNHRLVDTFELEDPDYVRNDTRRCFYCKNELYGRLRAIADDEGFAAVLDGTNADDLSDHRPGRDAAHKFGVMSPLAEIGFTKEDIREMSRRHGLETWDIPASPCLASRIRYGEPVTIGGLGRVEKSERFVRSLGFREFRVRSLGDSAKLEFASDEVAGAFDKATRLQIEKRLTEYGFTQVTIDPEPFRSGSMNRQLIGTGGRIDWHGRGERPAPAGEHE
ncbi:MAG: ATP-dependent sacrificial sulfur transferase LarE [Acidobacteriota bacterium]|nr:MAG: ATP-dependent sacrificial sulfur transferase LarE [Acidobacteriota bacterium]